jgi:hypothetical protein
MYKLNEIFDLFGLSYDISIDDMKRAKKVVLMTHPDKSGLGPEYFLFYKKAFDMVLQYYENQTKQNRVVPTTEMKYQHVNPGGFDKAGSRRIVNTINEMSTNDFQRKFNELFEENMAHKPDPTRNQWFTSETNEFEVPKNVSAKNMGQAFERFKEENAGAVLSRYRGVETLRHNSGSGFYEDEEADDQYVSCDPFSKLKFDDLRKVHKDQTVLTVSEKDYQKIPHYTSTDHYMQVRGKQTLTPLEKHEAEKLLSTQEKQFQESIMQKEYHAKLRTMEYEQKNKSVISSFLQLKN